MTNEQHTYLGKNTMPKNLFNKVKEGILSKKEEDVASNVYRDDIKWKGWGFQGAKEDISIDADLRVYMPIEIYHKLFTYISLTNIEISGLGIVEMVNDVFLIKDIFLIDQENTQAHTSLDKDSIAKKQFEMIQQRIDPSHMKFWWHSHNTMSTSWSGTDDACCEAYNNDEWLLSIVANHKREIRCRLDLYKPIRMTLDGLEVIIQDASVSKMDDITKQCKADMEKHVKEKKFTKAVVGYGQHNYYQDSRWGDDMMCPRCNTYLSYCQCPVEKSGEKELMCLNDFPDDVDAFFEWAKTRDEYNVYDSSIQAIEWLIWNYYEMIASFHFDVGEYIDCFGIGWKWDSLRREYDAVDESENSLTHKDYADLAFGIVQQELGIESEG